MKTRILDSDGDAVRFENTYSDGHTIGGVLFNYNEHAKEGLEAALEDAMTQLFSDEAFLDALAAPQA